MGSLRGEGGVTGVQGRSHFLISGDLFPYKTCRGGGEILTSLSSPPSPAPPRPYCAPGPGLTRRPGSCPAGSCARGASTGLMLTHTCAGPAVTPHGTAGRPCGRGADLGGRALARAGLRALPSPSAAQSPRVPATTDPSDPGPASSSPSAPGLYRALGLCQPPACPAQRAGTQAVRWAQGGAGEPVLPFLGRSASPTGPRGLLQEPLAEMGTQAS